MSKDNRTTLEDLMTAGFFWVPAFEIYNSVSGLYDLGPNGVLLENNLLEKWKKHFMLRDDMLPVRCPALTPRPVLDASGHTAKFSDYMLTDKVNSQLYRADQYIASVLKARAEKEKDPAKMHQLLKDAEDVDGMTREQLIDIMAKYEIKSPEGNELSTPEAFNLMFGTRVGPGARSIEAYLRPETAQGIFTDFIRLYQQNRSSLPFAAVQIGSGYRNEISPRNGLVRCREFQMAEIEHFADPEKLNDFPKFDRVKDLKVTLFPDYLQEEEDETKRVTISLTLEEALNQGIISHKTLGYYMGRVYQFLVEIGIKPETIRFRKHRQNEKAHYSKECWDAEIYTDSLGWLECVGIADRQSYDLTQHIKFSNKEQIYCTADLETPIKEHHLSIQGVKAHLGKAYGKDLPAITAALEKLTDNEIKAIQTKVVEGEKLLSEKPTPKNVVKLIAALNPENKAKFEELTKITVADKVLSYPMYTIVDEIREIKSRRFVPNVIEPSFGVGRIMTCLLEQSFTIRDDRRILRFSPYMAPYKVAVCPVTNKIPADIVDDIHFKLTERNLMNKVENSSISIGKKYSRSDEIGIPFAIALDNQTIEDKTITLRERDSMKQVRGTVQQIIDAIVSMVNGTAWEVATKDLPVFDRPEN